MEQTDAASGAADARLRAVEVTLGYDRRVIAEQLSVDIPTGSFTVIVGPNACGKSTLLRALARVMKPSGGAVLLDDAPIGSYPPKEVARRLGLLPQTSTAPEGITVADLVARGRHPHQSVFRQWSAGDERAVAAALAATNTADLAGLRAAGAAAPPACGRRSHSRRGAARSEPGGAVCGPPRGDERRPRGHQRGSGGGAHRRAGRGGLRTSVHDHPRPAHGHAAGGAAAALSPSSDHPRWARIRMPRPTRHGIRRPCGASRPRPEAVPAQGAAR
ncbi:hypothetical protein HA402_008543 [Bradysia odoriphaga]|nr:hypothetical protein HA402_008543 [Bradysia odoriphaga]